MDIRTHNGIEPIVRCLFIADPMTVKYAMRALSILSVQRASSLSPPFLSFSLSLSPALPLSLSFSSLFLSLCSMCLVHFQHDVCSPRFLSGPTQECACTISFLFVPFYPAIRPLSFSVYLSSLMCPQRRTVPSSQKPAASKALLTASSPPTTRHVEAPSVA